VVTFNNGLNNVLELSFLNLETQMVEKQHGNLIPNGVKCNGKRNWVLVLRLITMNCSGEVIRQLQAYVLNLLFSWMFEHKCGFGDLQTFCNIMYAYVMKAIIFI